MPVTLLEYLTRRASAEANTGPFTDDYTHSGYNNLLRLERDRVRWASASGGAERQATQDIRTARQRLENPATVFENKKEYTKWSWCRRETLRMSQLL